MQIIFKNIPIFSLYILTREALEKGVKSVESSNKDTKATAIMF